MIHESSSFLYSFFLKISKIKFAKNCQGKSSNCPKTSAIFHKLTLKFPSTRSQESRTPRTSAIQTVEAYSVTHTRTCQLFGKFDWRIETWLQFVIESTAGDFEMKNQVSRQSVISGSLSNKMDQSIKIRYLWGINADFYPSGRQKMIKIY